MLRSTLSSSTTLGSSSDAPLLCLVLCFFGGSLGSDSPRLHVTRAFERLFGQVERGAIVVEEREVVIITGNPGVPRDNPYPTWTKPVPVYTGTGFCGFG